MRLVTKVGISKPIYQSQNFTVIFFVNFMTMLDDARSGVRQV
jgi:hypothetical protein